MKIVHIDWLRFDGQMDTESENTTKQLPNNGMQLSWIRKAVNYLVILVPQLRIRLSWRVVVEL